MSDMLVIGQRRAAQRLGAAALKAVGENGPPEVGGVGEASTLAAAVMSALVTMVSEIPEGPDEPVRVALPGASRRNQSDVKYLKEFVDPVFGPVMKELIEQRPEDVKGWCVEKWGAGGGAA